MAEGQAENKKIKIDVNSQSKSGATDLNRSGPRINDIRNKSSRWRSLPTKNVVKIKEEEKKNRSIAYYFYKGLFFVACGITGLAVIGFVLYWQLFASRSTAAALLPAETLLYGQVDIEGVLFKDAKRGKSLADIAQKSNFSVDKVIKNINQETEPLGIKFVTDIKPFLGENFVFSFFSTADESGNDQAEWVFIVDVFDKKMAGEALEKMGYKTDIKRENYQEVEIIDINKKEGGLLTKAVFIEDYLIISYSQEHLEAIIDTYQQKRASLAQQSAFNNINPLVLREKFAYLYLRPDQLSGFLSQGSNLHILWKSLAAKMPTAFITFEAKEKGLAVNLEASYSDKKAGRRVSKELIDVLPVETSGFIAGRDFDQEFFELKQDLVANSPVVEFYLNNLIRKTEERAKVEINSELLEYLGDEYVVAFDNTNGQTNYNFIFKLKNQAVAVEKTKEVEEAISNYLGTVHPKKEEITLADGSKANELLPNKEAFPFTDLDYDGTTIRSVINPELTNNFSYALTDDKLLVSTSLESLKNMLTAISTPNKLLNKQYFNTPNSAANSWRSENVVYADISDLTDYLKISATDKKYLEPFDTFLFSFFSQNDKVYLQGFLYME